MLLLKQYFTISYVTLFLQKRVEDFLVFAESADGQLMARDRQSVHLRVLEYPLSEERRQNGVVQGCGCNPVLAQLPDQRLPTPKPRCSQGNRWPEEDRDEDH